MSYPHIAMVGASVLAVAGAVTLATGLTLTAQAQAPAPTPTSSATIEPGIPCDLNVYGSHDPAYAYKVERGDEAWYLSPGADVPVCAGVASLADLSITAPEGPGAIGELTGVLEADAASIYSYRGEDAFTTVTAILDDGDVLIAVTSRPFGAE